MQKLVTCSREETQEFGSKLVSQLSAGDIVALVGDVGSGKTELVRGFMREVSPDSVVRSPSFSLVNSYPTDNFQVNHFDFYRLTYADDLFEMGYDEYLSDEALCFIEWGDMFEDALPDNTRYIKFVEADGDRRVIEHDFII